MNNDEHSAGWKFCSLREVLEYTAVEGRTD